MDELKDSVKSQPGLENEKRMEFRLLAAYSKTTRPFGFDARTLVRISDTTIKDYSRLQALLIQDLRPGDHKEVLAWATEYLSTNIAGYASSGPLRGAYAGSYGLQYDVRASHWAEADGGMQTVDYKALWQRRTRAGVINRHYILDPVRIGKLIDFEVALLWAPRSLYPVLIHFKQPNDLSLLEIKQLAFLHLARQERLDDHLRHMGFDLQELEKWARGLLRRYLYASECLPPALVRKASLRDLRACFDGFIVALRDKEKRPLLERSWVNVEPWHVLDEDLFQPVAWGFGQVLAQYLKAILDSGGIDKFAASTWKNFHKKREGAQVGLAGQSEAKDKDKDKGEHVVKQVLLLTATAHNSSPEAPGGQSSDLETNGKKSANGDDSKEGKVGVQALQNGGTKNDKDGSAAHHGKDHEDKGSGATTN